LLDEADFIMISLSQSWKDFLKWYNDLTSENYRRFAIRLTTSLLIFIVGPSMAWDALEIKGIVIYLAANTLAKFFSSFIAKRNTNIANFSYRYASIIALLIAAIASVLVSLYSSQIPTYYYNSYVTIILPVLLGIFEGSYWASFLGISAATTERKRLKGFTAKGMTDNNPILLSDEQYNRLVKMPMTLNYDQYLDEIPGLSCVKIDKKTASKFQTNEVLATAIIASFIYIIDHNFPEIYFDIVTNSVAVLCVIVALFIRVGEVHKDESGTIIRRDRSPLKSDKEKRNKAIIISGLFAIMQLSASWSMTIFALSNGGVSLLAIYLAIAELAGFLIVDVLPIIFQRFRDWLKEDPTIVWKSGHDISLFGFVVMALGVILESKTIFVIGWLCSQAVIRGMLRGREIIFSNQHLQSISIPIKNDEIGLRERIKFTMHLLYVGVILICYNLYLYLGYTSESLLVATMLFCGTLCAIIQLERSRKKHLIIISD